MIQHISLLVIFIMIGSLCAFLWTAEPAEELKNAQANRVKKVSALTFH